MKIKYSEEHRQKMLESGRKSGFIKKRIPVLLKYIADLPTKEKKKKILDFGAGYYAHNLKKLKDLGCINIKGYDLPENVAEWEIDVDREALSKEWDIILLSNVINVQPDQDTAINLLLSLFAKNLNSGGFLLFNIPSDPRYFYLDKNRFNYAISDLIGPELKEIKIGTSKVYRIDKP